MMAEAKKMMDNPEFQKQMKKMSNSKEFKDGVQKTGKTPSRKRVPVSMVR